MYILCPIVPRIRSINDHNRNDKNTLYNTRFKCFSFLNIAGYRKIETESVLAIFSRFIIVSRISPLFLHKLEQNGKREGRRKDKSFARMKTRDRRMFTNRLYELASQRQQGAILCSEQSGGLVDITCSSCSTILVKFSTKNRRGEPCIITEESRRKIFS